MGETKLFKKKKRKDDIRSAGLRVNRYIIMYIMLNLN